MKYVLAIAGSDPSGGAGIQADIKTITSLGAHALTVITAVTAQNSIGITGIHKIPARFISKQIETIVDDLSPHSVKIGMLLTGEAVREVARMVKRYGIETLVVDPVIRASTGMPLLKLEAVPVLKRVLFPLARVVTPNLDEAEILTGKRVRSLQEMKEASKAIKGLGPDVVITGGHQKDRCVDLLYDGKDIHLFPGSRIATRDTHGSGCVFSSALATFLAMVGDIREATRLAHDFTRSAIRNAYPCGRGAGAVRPG
ncbi:MAG: bifunctional hydroxymethylpyrimidine kinase/phosphomethylpyrimidine kinase [Pseudomonadota bacterium]